MTAVRVILAGLALVTACRADSTDATFRERLHADVHRTIGEIPLRTDSSAHRSIRLDVDAFIYRLGLGPRNDAEEFGAVYTGALLPGGWAVVGDQERDRIVAITPGGRALPFGREGEGPAEFQQPTTVLADRGDTVTIRDNLLFRSTRLVVNAAGVHVVESLRFENQPDGVCRYGDELVTLDYDVITEHPLRSTDGRGRVRRSFGLPLVRGSNWLNASMSQGEILCLPDRGLVIHASTQGDILAYEVGTDVVRWRRHLADFKPVRIEPRAGGVVFIYAPPPERRGMFIASLHRLTDSIAILQTGVHLGREMPDGSIELSYGPIETRFLDLATGAEIGRQAGIPWILDLRDGALLVKGDEPEPWVGLQRFRVVRDAGEHMAH